MKYLEHILSGSVTIKYKELLTEETMHRTKKIGPIKIIRTTDTQQRIDTNP